MPEPLRMSFWIAKEDVPNWQNLKNGDVIRFTCTFDILTSGEFPQIDARMTLKP
jgi:hypothetical protein